LLFSFNAESADAAVLSSREQRCEGPGQSVCDLHPQEFGAADSPHYGVIDVSSPSVLVVLSFPLSSICRMHVLIA